MQDLTNKKVPSFPKSVIKEIFNERAERISKLTNKPKMRSSRGAIVKMEELVRIYAANLSDKVIEVVSNSGLNTAYEKHVTFYQTITKESEK